MNTNGRFSEGFQNWWNSICPAFGINLLDIYIDIYYLFFHITFNTVDIVENGNKTVSNGLPTIFSKIITNTLYYIFILLIIAYQAYENLGLAFSIPILLGIVFLLVSKFLIKLINTNV